MSQMCMRREIDECQGDDLLLHYKQGNFKTTKPFATLTIEKDVQYLQDIPDFFHIYEKTKRAGVNN